MRLSSVIIFTAFVLSATASPIDGYIPNSIRRRGHGKSKQASQGYGGPQAISVHKYFDETMVMNSGEVSHVTFRHRVDAVAFHAHSLTQPSQHHRYIYKEYPLPDDMHVQDFQDSQNGEIMLSQVKLNAPFARRYSQGKSGRMGLGDELWMASYPEGSPALEDQYSFTFRDDATPHLVEAMHLRQYFDPNGAPMLSIIRTHDSQWKIKYDQ